MLGVTFGSKHSYNDWGIWLEDTHINPPLPKRYIVDVPARNGLLDLTPELTPTIRFENRTLTFTFRVKAGDWSTLVSQIYGDIHGKTLDVVSDLDPNWHWHGCVTVDDFSSDERTGVLVITVDADPFKLSNTENSYTVNGNGTITCEVDRMEISPAFEIEAPTTVIYGDSSYAIESTATTEKTLSGEIVSFDDGTANPVVDLTADIEAVQDLHGYDNPWVGGAGKNILPLTVSQIKASNTGGSTWSGNTFTYFGVTWTILVDGSNNVVGIKANGTATSSVNLYCNFTVPSMVSSGDYYFSGCPSGGSGSTYDIFMWDIQSNARAKKWDGTTSSASDVGSSANNEVKLVDGHTYQLAMRVYSGYSANITFYPMIRKSTDSSAFAPYENICPISGWDEVNVTRTGKNLLADTPRDIGTFSGVTVSVNGSGQIVLNGTATANNNARVGECTLPVGSYTFTGMTTTGSGTTHFLNISPQWGGTSNQNLYSGYYSGTTTERTTFTVRIYFRSGATFSNTIYEPMIRLATETDATFEPYNGQTYNTDLDGTRYGGTLDVTTGVLTVTDRMYQFSSSTNGVINWNGFLAYVAQGNLVDANTINCLCSHAKAVSNNTYYSNQNTDCVASVGTETQLRFRNLACSTVEDYQTYFGTQANNGTPVTFTYKLATPQAVQLTAEQVTTLKNQNNIWADSGEVEVTYLAQDFAGRKFFIPDLELTEGSHSLTIQGTGTTTVTYTNGRL